MTTFLHILILGTIWGALYRLIAVGFTLIFGVAGIISLSPGTFYMLGGLSALHLHNPSPDQCAPVTKPMIGDMVVMATSQSKGSKVFSCRLSLDRQRIRDSYER